MDQSSTSSPSSTNGGGASNGGGNTNIIITVIAVGIVLVMLIVCGSLIFCKYRARQQQARQKSRRSSTAAAASAGGDNNNTANRNTSAPPSALGIPPSGGRSRRGSTTGNKSVDSKSKRSSSQKDGSNRSSASEERKALHLERLKQWADAQDAEENEVVIGSGRDKLSQGGDTEMDHRESAEKTTESTSSHANAHIFGSMEFVDKSFHISAREATEAGHDDIFCRRMELIEQGDYVKFKMLGRGTYGKVYQCVLGDGSHVAMKELVVPTASSNTDQLPEEFIRTVRKEVRIMMNLNHPNIIKCYGCHIMAREMKVLLFMELASGGSLQNLARTSKNYVSEDVAKRMIVQVVSALRYIHDLGYVHRDIKGDNIVLTQKGTIKIIDFGTATFVGSRGTSISVGATTLVGSPLFVAPEVLNHSADLDNSTEQPIPLTDSHDEGNKNMVRTGGYGRTADVWSFGICLLELMNRGNPPWPNFPNQAAALSYISSPEGVPHIPKHLTPECKSFIQRCLERDPKVRASMVELQCDPWLMNRTAAFLATNTPSPGSPNKQSSTGEFESMPPIGFSTSSPNMVSSMGHHNSDRINATNGEDNVVPSGAPPGASDEAHTTSQKSSQQGSSLQPAKGQTTTTSNTQSPSATTDGTMQQNGRESPMGDEALVAVAAAVAAASESEHTDNQEQLEEEFRREVQQEIDRLNSCHTPSSPHANLIQHNNGNSIALEAWDDSYGGTIRRKTPKNSTSRNSDGRAGTTYHGLVTPKSATGRSSGKPTFEAAMQDGTSIHSSPSQSQQQRRPSGKPSLAATLVLLGGELDAPASGNNDDHNGGAPPAATHKDPTQTLNESSNYHQFGATDDIGCVVDIGSQEEDHSVPSGKGEAAKAAQLDEGKMIDAGSSFSVSVSAFNTMDINNHSSNANNLGGTFDVVSADDNDAHLVATMESKGFTPVSSVNGDESTSNRNTMNNRSGGGGGTYHMLDLSQRSAGTSRSDGGSVNMLSGSGTKNRIRAPSLPDDEEDDPHGHDPEFSPASGSVKDDAAPYRVEESHLYATSSGGHEESIVLHVDDAA